MDVGVSSRNPEIRKYEQSIGKLKKMTLHYDRFRAQCIPQILEIRHVII